MAAHLGAPTEFRVLNPPGGGSAQVVTCGMGQTANPLKEIEVLKKMTKTGPCRQPTLEPSPQPEPARVAARSFHRLWSRAAVTSAICAHRTGRTPLCAQIYAVTQRVREQEAALRAAGQRVVVVIASDGAATDGDIEVRRHVIVIA